MKATVPLFKPGQRLCCLDPARPLKLGSTYTVSDAKAYR